MKKVLICLVTVAMIAVSCQSESWNIFGFDKGVDVVLKATTPLMGVTRGEGSSLDSALGAIDNFDTNTELWDKYDLRYILQIYTVTEVENDFVTSDEPIFSEVVTRGSYKEMDVEFDLHLVPNRMYKFVMWADFVDEGTTTDLHYNTKNLRSISRTEEFAHAAMEEALDAYYISHTETIKTSGDLELILTRPFAKLRVVAIDHHEISNYLTLKQVDVKFDTDVNPVFTTFNAVNYELTNNCTNHTYSYSVDPAPYKEYSGTTDDGQAINGFVLFSDYILAPRDGEQPVSFSMDIYDQKGLMRTAKFDTQIPTRRNHLTTVIGNCLTTQHTSIISIEDTLLSREDLNIDAEDATK